MSSANEHNMQQNKTILIATGASGGHVFPALAVAEKLKQQGCTCIFVGNEGKFLDMVSAEGFTIERLPAAPFNVSNPIKKMKAIFFLVRAFGRALKLVHRYKASAVFGTGGYATVALVLAGKVAGTPTVIAEQNVLPGRANRFLSKWVDCVCLTFESSRHYLKYRDGVMVTCGNPIRESIVTKALQMRENGTKTKDETKTIFIMGGSQGAKILSDIVPSAIELLPYNLKKQIRIIQQTRPEDTKRVIADYNRLDVPADVQTFFSDMPEVLSKTDLVIARSGASTICETALFSIPAVYVPLRRLADGHQVLNAKAMEGVGAALVMDQHEFTAEKLATTLEDLLGDKTRLEQMAKAAREFSQPNAACAVAKEVLRLSEQDVMCLVGTMNPEKDGTNS